MKHQATVIPMSIQRMVCTGCGAEANASCNCGVSYVPKPERFAKTAVAQPLLGDLAYFFRELVTVRKLAASTEAAP
jgi:hypothetical protein